MFKMNDTDIEILYKLVEEITGTSQQGSKKKEIIQNSVVARLEDLKINDFSKYLKLLKNDSKEYALFVNIITIHTTSWFREQPHFNDLQSRVENLYQSGQKHFKIISLACSTGQEVYSVALLMQSLIEKLPQLTYEIVGSDIDSVSIAAGQRCIYRNEELSQIPKKFHQYILMGFEKNQGFFTLDSSLRKKVSFRNINLKDGFEKFKGEKFDFVFLRNVLIYFDLNDAIKLVSNCASVLTDQGLLMLGHSEFPVDIPPELTRFSSSCLMKNLKNNKKNFLTKDLNRPPVHEPNHVKETGSVPKTQTKRRLLLIDDFTVIRASIKSALADCNFLIDEAASAEKASEMLEHNTYDLITLDINLPGENGTQWLRRQRASGLKTPIVIISSTESKEAALVFGALSDGAQDYISKEVLYKNRSELVATVNALIYSDKSKSQHQKALRTGKKQNYTTGSRVSPEVIVIGSSTGGPDALWNLLKNLAPDNPPIVIVQHISVQFSEHFASTLKRVSGLEVRGHIDGEYLNRNHIYVARGDYHLTVKSSDKGLYICHDLSEAVNGFRPSVDVLFHSVALIQEPVMAIILTGMGADGAQGMKQIHKRENTFTIAQSEESCIVFGMPKEAIEMGGVHFVGDLLDIRKQIEDCAKLPRLAKNKAS